MKAANKQIVIYYFCAAQEYADFSWHRNLWRYLSFPTSLQPYITTPLHYHNLIQIE